MSKYLFFDLEYATCKTNSIKICEFGYVLTDEKFEIIEKNNLIINSGIEVKAWDKYALKNILTRTREYYESCPSFEDYYPQIKGLINGACYVIGFSFKRDVRALNGECKRYELPSIDYKFCDTQEIYKVITNTKDIVGLANMLKKLDVERKDLVHDAANDAYNTMLALKKMLQVSEISFQSLIKKHPTVVVKTQGFVIKSNKGFDADKKKIV